MRNHEEETDTGAKVFIGIMLFLLAVVICTIAIDEYSYRTAEKKALHRMWHADDYLFIESGEVITERDVFFDGTRFQK